MAQTRRASTQLAKKPATYPTVVTMIPVRSGPPDWPISMIDESAPMDAPICSFFATSAT